MTRYHATSNGDIPFTAEEESEADAEMALVPAELGLQVRTLRNVLLEKCDYVTLRSTDQGIPVPAEWATYRQALRDITNNVNFPYLTPADWPVQP
jgi:hypothetical protein